MYSDLFAGSDLLYAQKFASECYVTARLIRTITQRSVFYAQPHVFGALRALRNKTENLCLINPRQSSNVLSVHWQHSIQNPQLTAGRTISVRRPHLARWPQFAHPWIREIRSARSMK